MDKMKDKKNMKDKRMGERKSVRDDKTPTYLLILIALLVLIAFAVITISSNMKKTRNENIMQEINRSIDNLENLDDSQEKEKAKDTIQSPEETAPKPADDNYKLPESDDNKEEAPEEKKMMPQPEGKETQASK